MFKSVTLEVSLKPFKQTDDEYIKEVCEQIFTKWRPLLKNRETISIMMWTSDGSEILDYAGNLEDEFEWCKYLGTANHKDLGNDEPLQTSLHERRQLYIENPPKMTYSVLKNIISCLKNVGKKHFPSSKIRVGETFDIGPEFAYSEFKYIRHTEICTGSVLDHCGFVDATARLNGDTRKYAAYPNGIPDGTLFGTFLGKQSEIFLADMGFDYLWLSNGLGFSANPWDKTGKIFDGEKYFPEKLEETKKNVFAFWRLFRDECSFPLETRGTNNSVGIDYASDGVPLYDIYNAGLDITPPPNSPWAALNDNFGLEIMGHMTRICELPKNDFMFRYYIHDPWWLNTPWYDRYDGAPSDIYLPMAVSRITPEGKTQSASLLNVLSIYNSFGDMPDSCVNEPLPHILKAEKDAPDAPAPLVWVYPMREYTTSNDSDILKEMNEGDNFICNAINEGLPLCCVTSTDAFLKQDLSIYKGSIFISPVPMSDDVANKLAKFDKVIYYGSPEALDKLKDKKSVKVDMSTDISNMLSAIEIFGFSVKFNCKTDTLKPPTLAISKSDGALFFNVYNSNTTSDAYFKFPLGAPILLGGETELVNGFSTYRFNRAEHRECRIFVKQKDGVISCREAAPSNTKYTRKIKLAGLKDATVYYFPENKYPFGAIASDGTVNSDTTPHVDERFKMVHDEIYGDCLVGEHITGDFYICRNTIKD